MTIRNYKNKKENDNNKDILVADVTALSTKGQIVLPKSIREALNLKIGTKFIVIIDGKNILLKPIEAPDVSEFDRLMDKAQEWAKSVGMQPEDLDEIIKEARKRVKK